MSSAGEVRKTITIQAQSSQVWDTLTRAESVQQWLSEGGVQVYTDWTVGSQIHHSGPWHGQVYEGKGIVLACEIGRLLRYSHWSPIMRVPDNPDSYAIIEFSLIAQGDATQLTVTHSNLTPESAVKHSAFYWGATLVKIKRIIEQGSAGNQMQRS